MLDKERVWQWTNFRRNGAAFPEMGVLCHLCWCQTFIGASTSPALPGMLWLILVYHTDTEGRWHLLWPLEVPEICSYHLFQCQSSQHIREWNITTAGQARMGLVSSVATCRVGHNKSCTNIKNSEMGGLLCLWLEAERGMEIKPSTPGCILLFNVLHTVSFINPLDAWAVVSVKCSQHTINFSWRGTFSKAQWPRRVKWKWYRHPLFPVFIKAQCLKGGGKSGWRDMSVNKLMFNHTFGESLLNVCCPLFCFVDGKW